MHVWRAILTARFRLLLQYRAAAWAGVATQVFFGLVLIAVLRAFYGSSTVPPPLPEAAMVTYLWLNQAFFSLLPWRVDGDVQAQVRTGGLAYELARPVDLHALWLARAVALKTAPVLLRAAPLFVVAGLFFGLAPPASPVAAAWWLAGLAGAVMMAAAIVVLMNTSLLWTLSGEGVAFLLPILVAVLSGQLLPLPLWPEWMQPGLQALPFRGLLDTPHRLYTGELAGPAAAAALAHQWIWVGVFLVSGRWILRRGMRRVAVQGG
jgi:ABC-2 type transport system permease protein